MDPNNPNNSLPQQQPEMQNNTPTEASPQPSSEAPVTSADQSLPTGSLIPETSNMPPASSGETPNPALSTAPVVNPTQNVPAQPQPQSNPVTTPIAGPASYSSSVFQPNSKSSSTNKILIIAVVVMVIILGGIGGYLYTKSSDKSSQNTKKSASTVEGTGSSTQASSANANEVDTNCFKFKVADGHGELPNENICDLSLVQIGKSDLNTLSVFPETYLKTASFEASVQKWKTDNKSYKIVKEEKVSVGGLPAQKIVTTLGSTESIYYIVYTNDRKYTVQNSPIQGFYIFGSYSNAYNPDTTQNFDNAIKSWTWK